MRKWNKKRNFAANTKNHAMKTENKRMEMNTELAQAWDFVEHTGRSIFLTGKAGTGKTTFLRTVMEQSKKRAIVVAPTGVAAINAGGVTIHSFFQLPLSPFVPNAQIKSKFDFNRTKRKVIVAQLFKLRHKDSFIGGPAYYIQKGMHNRWMSALFAILITITFGLSYNSIQSNTICQAMNEAFGWNQVLTGIVLVMMSLTIVFGGIQRIAKVSSVIVPVMAIGYFILAFVIVLMNIHLMPHVFKVIISNAFGLEQITGGGLGATMMNGIKRGLFSNEAGEGSAPNVAATASVSHPVKQGLIQALGVFTDTLLVCSCTAFIILISGLYAHPELNGIALTQSALQSEIGSSGPIFIAIAIFLFAFSSIIGNYYYGEANIRFLFGRKEENNNGKLKSILFIYRLCSGGVLVMFGALASLEIVWNLGDLCMALLTACNLIAILVLGKYAFKLLKDYQQQKKNGIKDPIFHRSQLPEIENELECWE